MAVSRLRRWAARSPAAVFPALGDAADAALAALALASEVELAASPRHASVLLVAGGIAPPFQAHLRRLHAQLPRPCGTLWFRSAPLPEFAAAPVLEDVEQLPDALVRLHRRVVCGAHAEPVARLPDTPPLPWQGRGEHGQGGEGMMGGTPYGRPLAMTAPDLRDGLQLDPLRFTIGPFFAPFPPGLLADVELQGDLVQRFAVQARPYPARVSGAFAAALAGPVAIADLELARARRHLRHLAHAARVLGLGLAARRLLRRAARLRPGDTLADLRAWLRRSGMFAAVAPGCGRLSAARAAALGGPAARAAGLAQDARAEDAAYRALGFVAVCNEGGDCRARWRQWLDESEQALGLAARAAAARAHTGPAAWVETPRGPMSRTVRPADASALLPELLRGLAWSEAMAVLTSLDLAALSPHPAGGGG